MPKNMGPVNQGNIPAPNQIGSGGAGKVRSKQPSKFRHQVLARDANNVAIIDLEDRDLVVAQAQIKRRVSDRRADRIEDIAGMLAENRALTGKEEKWLKDLGENHPEAYNKLRKLLSVPKFWRPGQRGVLYREDRNRIRQQTLKAAVFEAAKTADSDTTVGDKERTIDRALNEAAQIRWALNRPFPQDTDAFRRMKKKTRQSKQMHGLTKRRFRLGRKRRMYNFVRTKTLRNPKYLYDAYNRQLANKWLAEAVRPPREIHPRIDHKRQVARAVKALVKNRLLDKGAAVDLLDRLRTKPDLVNRMTSLTDKYVWGTANRDKVKSLMLLALAYAAPRDLPEKVSFLLTLCYADGARVNAKAKTPPCPGYDWLPDVPASGSLGAVSRKSLISWAMKKEEPPASPEAKAPPVSNEHGDNEVKKDVENKWGIPEIDFGSYELTPEPPPLSEQESSRERQILTGQSKIFRRGRIGTAELYESTRDDPVSELKTEEELPYRNDWDNESRRHAADISAIDGTADSTVNRSDDDAGNKLLGHVDKVEKLLDELEPNKPDADSTIKNEPSRRKPADNLGKKGDDDAGGKLLEKVDRLGALLDDLVPDDANVNTE